MGWDGERTQGIWGLGLKRPKLRLAGPLLSQQADDARQATGRGAQTDVGLRRDGPLIQGHRARLCKSTDRWGTVV